MVDAFVCLFGIFMAFSLRFASGDSSGVCDPGIGGQQIFLINLDSDGKGQCGVSPAPLKVLDWMEHHGACLAECATFQGCSSYNYHYDTHGCELFCMPTEYSYIPNCFHYLKSNDLFCATPESNPCENDGLCTDICHNYTCVCLPGFTGRNCETNINECESNPCSEDRTCQDGINSFACICHPGCGGLNCSEQYNMARGQPVTQSSTFPNMIADRSVDGNYDTNGLPGYCSATNDDPGGPNWFMVDLGSISTIKYVVVTNRGDGWIERMDYFIVGVTNTSWTTQAPVRGAYPLCGQYPYTAPAGARMTVNCAASTPPARYVIIQQPANGAGLMNFCELEVYSRCN